MVILKTFPIWKKVCTQRWVVHRLPFHKARPCWRWTLVRSTATGWTRPAARAAAAAGCSALGAREGPGGIQETVFNNNRFFFKEKCYAV